MPSNPTPIDVTQSNDYILTHRAIKERTKRWAIGEINGSHRNDMDAAIPMPADPPDIPADADGFNKAKHFFQDKSNAYVFRREDFERFFLGTDPAQPGLNFTHCMIIVGSLKNNETDPTTGITRKRGEQTVLIAGCTPLGTDPEKFVTTTNGTPNGPTLNNIATEHPPHGHKVDLRNQNFLKFSGDDKIEEYKILGTERV